MAHIKRWNWFTQTALVCNKTHSVDTARWALDQQLYMTFYGLNLPRRFPRKHSNALHLRKSYSGWCAATCMDGCRFSSQACCLIAMWKRCRVNQGYFITHSVNIAMWAPDQRLYMTFYDVSLPRRLPRKHWNTLHIKKSFSGWSRAHLAAFTEWVSSQTNEGCLWINFTFHYGGLWKPIWLSLHSTNCYLSSVSLITS